MKPRRVTPPASLPVTLEEMKAYLRLDHDHEDATILQSIRSATDFLDGENGALRRSIIDQTWQETYSAFQSFLTLKQVDVKQIQKVEYLGPDAALQTLVADNYYLYDNQVHFTGTVPALAARPNAVQVTYVAGMGAKADDLPQDLKEAIMMRAATVFETRSDAVVGTTTRSMPIGFDQIIARYKVPSIRAS